MTFESSFNYEDNVCVVILQMNGWQYFNGPITSVHIVSDATGVHEEYMVSDVFWETNNIFRDTTSAQDECNRRNNVSQGT